MKSMYFIIRAFFNIQTLLDVHTKMNGVGCGLVWGPEVYFFSQLVAVALPSLFIVPDYSLFHHLSL